VRTIESRSGSDSSFHGAIDWLARSRPGMAHASARF